jgi:GT2 family glycosyltransferase
MKLVKLLFRFFIAVLYCLSAGFFFLASTVVQTYLQFGKKKLAISESEQKLDGVSVVIPTWNKKDLLLKCIDLLDARLTKEGSDIKKEIIVVENGSNDGSLEALQSLKTKAKLVILASPTNLGFSKGINWGVSTASFNYVYLLNNDMEVQPHFLDTVLLTARQFLKQKQPFFGLASQIFFYDPTKRREESGKNYSFENFGFLNVAHYVEAAALTETSLTLYPGGGSALINKKLFLSLGGYDHAAYIPLYCEDLDAGVVAWKYGFPSFFVPASEVIHHHQSSSKSLARKPEFFMHKNWLVVLLKNLDGWSAIVKHLLLFPIRIILSDEVAEYAIAALKHLPIIFQRRLAASQFSHQYSGAKILNFDDFELTHDFKIR